MTHLLFYNSPLGPLTLAEQDGGITELRFGKRPLQEGEDEASTPVLADAKTQLDEYFAGKRRRFDLPLAPKGTPFQKTVWNALCTIPCGETRSYKQLAELAGNPKGCRAVGMANNKNPIAILIPCHRVIAADGSLGGYGGGLDTKRFLLELECGGNGQP